MRGCHWHGHERAVRRFAAKLVITALVVSSGFGVCRAAAATIDIAVGQADAYARDHQVHAAVVVIDRKTGAFYGAGDYDHYYGSASVMKVFVAAKLLATGRMHGTTERLAYRMITKSDNNALEQLLPKVGGTRVVDWAQHHYHVSDLGAPPAPGKRWCWGNTHITAQGIATFYTRVLRDRKVGPWLSYAMHHYAVHDADGLDQIFGIPAAVTGAGIKQGEGHCSSDTNGSIINSTGLVAHNRFAVAILSQSHICCNRGGFNAEQAAIVTKMAHILFPHRHIDLPQWHNPRGQIVHAGSKGSTVTISGWALEPDLGSRSALVRIYDDAILRWQKRTSIRDRAFNRRHDLTGRHRFVAHLALKNGRHRVCVTFVNEGPGNASPRRCIALQVKGSPVGLFEPATLAPGSVTVSGWAYDRDVTPKASSVRVAVDPGTEGSTHTILLADLRRPRGTYPVRGPHGFATTVPLSVGEHTVCVTALDVGPVKNPNRSLGCQTVNLPDAGAK